MKTKRLVFSNISMSVVLTAVVVMVYAFTFSSAFAAVMPTVETVIKNGSNTTITTAPIGTVVRANTTVASSTGPVALGTVDFSLYPNMTCSGTATVQSGVLLASGVADSSTTTVGSSGLSYRVLYNGQTDVYASTTGPCVALTATSGTVGLNSTLSSTTITVGTSVYQSAILTGVTANATGTVAYGVYTNNSCTADKIDAGTKTVTNGTVSNSNSIQFNTVGTRYFQAVYSGDQFNGGATGSCQTVSVLASSTVPVPPTPVPGTIAGNVYNDLNKNIIKDGGESGIANVTIKLYDRSVWWNWKARWNNSTSFKTTTTDSNGNYSFSGLGDGIYGVEEIVPAGWKQISSDFRWVLVLNGKVYSDLNFANISKVNSTSTATTTPKKKNDDRKEEKKEQKKIEKQEKKEEKREVQKQKKINKLFERINKIRGNGNDNDRDD